MDTQLYNFISYTRELVYPRRCPVCSEIVIPKGEKICKDCRKKLPYIMEPFCKKCGKSVETEEQEYCFDCTKKEFSFVRGRALFEYNDVMKESIANFKFRGKKEYGDFYSEEMARLLKEDILSMKPDALIPIPMHIKKQRKRGYNQAEILAKKIGSIREIPVLTDVLIRNKNTLPQKKLNDKERLKNLERAFHIAKDVTVAAKNCNRVILIDDIYTTGSTIEACTKVLLEYGFREIYFISLCIGKGY